MPITELARSAVFRLFLVAGITLGITSAPPAQAQSTDRVLGRVDPGSRVTTRGHHPAWAIPQNDAGTLPAGPALTHLTLILARSPETQQAFEEFLARQQDPASTDYHHWLTPTEVGERFGVSANDITALSEWLRSQGLHVDSVSNSRVRLTFSGHAAAVGKAFSAEMRYFRKWQAEDRYHARIPGPALTVAASPQPEKLLPPAVARTMAPSIRTWQLCRPPAG